VSFDALVCDLDGVVYRGDAPIPGAVEALNALADRGIRIVYCTNNSRSTISQYLGKLTGLGLKIEPEALVTSAIVTAEVLGERHPSGAVAMVVGGDGIREALGSIGVEIRVDAAEDQVDLVVVGWDPGFDYDSMRRASLAVMAGASLIATNDDASFPAPKGLWPGAGAILASIEVASGARAEVMGKPHPPMMEAVARRLEGARKIAIVGDRPDTDLAGGASRGWTTILVTSGVTSPEAAKTVRPPPDMVIAGVAELV
jgi:glycerol-1-phosphatase